MVKMENNRKSDNQKEFQKEKNKKKGSRYACLILTLRLSFIEFDHYGWCWIYGFGFNKYGYIYQRKTRKDLF